VVHVRVIAPREEAEKARELLERVPTVTNLVYLKDAAIQPRGDMLLADVPSEEASVIIGDLKELGIHKTGSISVEPIEVQLSALADEAERKAPGAPADAVVWEQVEARTSEEARLSASFLVFMVLAALIASVGIYLDSPILVVGAMVVGPEFGPIAAFCVAVVEKRRHLAMQSLAALLLGFPLAILAVWAASHIFQITGATPDTFSEADHGLSSSIANPDFFAFFVAFCAGTAGMLSLSTAKSGALIGVLISVTTIPAAANVGVSMAYGDWPAFRGSLTQLAINIAGILVAGILTLWIQRLLYRARRRRHLRLEARAEAGLPVGVSARSPAPTTPPASSAPDPRRPS
jgi:uncharacterized hydrophobic protein (TIGR00271 family)